jgi:hypothetical protein
MRERKCDYVYGARAEAIRKVAKKGKPFTIEDVTRAKDVRRQLGKMVENGEIRRIVEGTRGRNRTTYQIA